MSATTMFRRLFAVQPRAARRQTPGRRTLRCETLEAREVPAYLSGGTLVIDGTDGVDTVKVEFQMDATGYGLPKYSVTHNGVVQRFSPFQVYNGTVRFNGAGGADTFDNSLSDLRAVVDGGEGNDRLIGGRSNDELRGGVGQDTVIGGDGADDLYGDQGDDRLIGARSENGVEEGGSTNDTVAGGDGRDTLYGGYGSDLLIGGNDNDWLDGQWAEDMVIGSNWDYVNDRPEESETTTILGATTNDTVSGGNGFDSVYGGVGNDQLSGGWDSDEIYGGPGSDRLWGAFSTSPVERDGFANDDTLVGGAGLDWLYGGVGNDVLWGAAKGNENLPGGAQDFSNYLYGQDGDDNLYGGNAYDYMDGGYGDDGLFGGKGYNVLNGGADDDRFLIWSAATDNVQDADDRDAILQFEDSPALQNVPPPLGWPNAEPYNFDAGEWTAAEIAIADQAFGNLHHVVENTALLALPTADGGWVGRGSYTFTRRGQQTSGDWNYGGENDGAGHITIAQGKSDTLNADTLLWTIYHEVGHSWGTADVNDHWTAFLGLSGWVQGAEAPNAEYIASDAIEDDWWYKSDAQFARSYGEMSPNEDWATTWETYFMDKYHKKFIEGDVAVQSKYAILDLLFADLRML